MTTYPTGNTPSPSLKPLSLYKSQGETEEENTDIRDELQKTTTTGSGTDGGDLISTEGDTGKNFEMKLRKGFLYSLPPPSAAYHRNAC